MQELERTKRAAEVAKSVGEDAATTWNESIRRPSSLWNNRPASRPAPSATRSSRAVERQAKVGRSSATTRLKGEDEDAAPGGPGDR